MFFRRNELSGATAWLGVCCSLALGLLSDCRAEPATSPSALAELRDSGNLPAQRQHVWQLLQRDFSEVESDPFLTWHGEYDTFGADSAEGKAPQGMRGFARVTVTSSMKPRYELPLLDYTLYNNAAFLHIRQHQLNRRATLDALRTATTPEPGQRTQIPEFPAESVIIKGAWWPVARGKTSPLPVWDPETNPPSKAGNPYIGWKRIVQIAAKPGREPYPNGVQFAGRQFNRVKVVDATAFYRITVDHDLAGRIMRDDEGGRLMRFVLGRPLAEGDSLVLVALHIARRDLEDWSWSTLWWHDQPSAEPYGEDRPADVAGVWRNYLMQTAWDFELPKTIDGSPHVSFNPWLEGRFPNAARSNCLACHHRASYPATPFLPVTTGRPANTDQAYSPTLLRTSSLWAIPMHAQP